MYEYSEDIKHTPGPRFPPPLPDEPRVRKISSATTYVEHTPMPIPKTPKTPKKTPIAQTVPLSALPLPAINTFPVRTPATAYADLNFDLPPIQPTVQPTHTPYIAPLSAVPRTPFQNTVPDSVLQNLGHIQPTHYTWDTPHGPLTFTPAHTSAFPLPNPLSPTSPRIADVDDGISGNDETSALGLIPSPISSDTSNSSETSEHPNSSHRFGVALHPMFASEYLPPNETTIEWDVSEPVDMVRHTVNDRIFIASVEEPATNPPTNTLRIEFCFLDQQSVKWNWEPINIHKTRPIRIADVFHAIHGYFHTQLTHPEYDIIKAYGKQNARIVAKSWRERIDAQPTPVAQSIVHDGGLRRVDCLGSSKIFAGLWVDGSQLKLGLRT